MYNANISSALYNMRKFELSGHVPAFYNYRYDQLNRYKGQDGYFNYNPTTNSYGGFTPVNTYKERVSYDANGNIQAYTRHNIHPSGTPMDELSYKYYPGTNQLRQVTDQVPDWQFGTNSWEVPDIDNQDDLNNYKYDAIGNLVKDESEKGMAIKWNVYGKITEITRNPLITDNNTTFRLRYSYDAAGNRIGKEQKWYNKGNSRYELSYTWYVRDAQGNLITTYVASTPDTSGNNLQNLFVEFNDQQIYGSSRLGSYSVKTNVDDGPIDRYVYTSYDAKFLRGWRQYELSNHLGNVLTTISDKKIGVSSGPVGSLIDYYEPDMVNAQDYFPFGMVSRFNGGNSDQQYRFGFNGKENDNEVKGFGGQQDYGMRIYDARLGRFLSVDPLTKDYPWYTPYQFAGNKPIKFIDLDGLEEDEGFFTKIGKYGFQGIFQVTWGDAEATTDAFNRNINPVGIAAHGVYGTTMGKDLVTGRSVNRIDAFTTMGVNGIMLLGGQRLGTLGMTQATKLESQMAANTFKSAATVSGKAAGPTTDPMIAEMSRTVYGALPSLSKNFSGNILKVEQSLLGQLEKHVATQQNGRALPFSIIDNSIKFSGNTKLGEWFDFVIMSNGELRIGNGHWALSQQSERVTAAGEVWINFKGKIESVSNNSGHYQPTRGELINAAKILKSNGLTTNDVQAVNVAP